jgi:hypothetical protein
LSRNAHGKSNEKGGPNAYVISWSYLPDILPEGKAKRISWCQTAASPTVALCEIKNHKIF